MITSQKEQKYCFGTLYPQDQANFLEDLAAGYYILSDAPEIDLSDVFILFRRGPYLDPKTMETNFDRGAFSVYILWRKHDTFREQLHLIKESGRFKYNEYLNLYSNSNRIMFTPVTHMYSLKDTRYVLKGFRAYLFLPNSK